MKNGQNAKAWLVAGWCLLLAGFNTFALRADVVDITQSSTTGYTMTDGNTYAVQNSLAISNSTTGGSGMTVDENAIVVLYVPAGVTLTAVGADGSGQIGGGAGILVPETSTLVITGEGTVNATGGRAGDGGNGMNGFDGSTTNKGTILDPSYLYVGGKGGSGGSGGGGAGAGIGGNGGRAGTGGTGGPEVSLTRPDREKPQYGKSGTQGGAGSAGATMGTVVVLGRICIEASAGGGGNNGSCGDIGALASQYLNGSLFAGGCGGGGGSGSTTYRGSGSSTISQLGDGHGGCGEGGASPTAAGESGSGAGSFFVRYNYIIPGSGIATGSDSISGGNGGGGGAFGPEGGSGILYASPTATINGGRESLPVTTHPSAEYTITFNANGGELSSAEEFLNANLGCELPDCIPTPTRMRHSFAGWSTAEGVEYYDAAGGKSLSCYPVAGDVVLLAQWELNSQTIEFPPIGQQWTTNVVELEAVASSGLGVEYAVDGPAVLEGNVLRFTGAGMVVVTASQAGDGNWEAAEDVVRSFEVLKAVAEVRLDDLDQKYDGEAKAVSVETVPEGLAVSVMYDGEAAVPVAVGSYAVMAMIVDDIWTGNAEGVLAIGKGVQQIDFAEIGVQWMTNTVTLSATANTGLPVTFAVVSGPGVLNGEVLSFTGLGRVVVEAVQAGDESWEEVRVTQAVDVVRENIVSIEPEESIVSPLGGTGSVNIHVTEGARWVAEPMAEWLSIPEGAEGVGEGSVTYRAEAKFSEEARSGQIRFFSPASVPENEGDSGRTIWFETNAVDLATGSRTISPSFPITFDGTFEKTLMGEALPQRNENDFAVRLHFCIGELYDINRLMTVFGHSLYANDGNKLVFEGHVGATVLGTDSAYWVTVSQNQEKNVSVTLMKEGDSEGTVDICYEAEEFLHDFTAGTTALGDAFRLGYGTVPSAGYLKNATIYGIEFWNRGLTTTEAKSMMGKNATYEVGPVGAPAGIIATHFRLNQNGCSTTSTNTSIQTVTDNTVSLTDWSAGTGRNGLPGRSLASTGNGRMVISDINSLFDGEYVLNNGKPLDQNNYGHVGGNPMGYGGWVPYPVTSTGPFNATYNFWIYLEELPQAPVSLFERLRVSGKEADWDGTNTNEWYAKNVSLNLDILSSGLLLVMQNGVKNACVRGALETGRWSMVTFVGENERSITVYKDGEEIGHFDSELTFAFFPPTDGRAYRRASAGIYWTEGSVVPTVQSFTIGGWNGALDEVTFYRDALTAEQVKDLYDSGKPQYYYHTVRQELKGQTIDFPGIGAQWATNVVELGAVASSGLEVGYEVVSGPGVLDGAVLSFTGLGTVVVEASQAGDGTWWAANPVRQEVEVSAVPVEVVLSGLEQVYDGEAKVVGVATEPEGVPVRVTYDGEEEAPVHAGDYAVVAETADARYEGRAEGILAVARAGQEIDFPAVGWQVWTNEVGLGAVASSGLPVGYAVVSGPGTVSGNVLSFSGPGTVRVSAGQAGNGDWAPAQSVEIEVVAGKATASVVLGDLAQVFDGGARMVAVETVPAGLAVAVTYDGVEAAPTGAGSYGVVATVVDEVWEGSAEGTLVVAKGAQGIEFAEIGEQVATNVVELGAVASSGLEVSYTVVGPAVVEGNVLSFTGSGTVTVTASQAGNANWEAAEDVVRSFEVVKASAVVELSGLEQVYDGGTHGVGVVTVPEGVAVAVTYDGSGEEPVDAGSYAVVAGVVDEVWEGRAEGVLVVAKGAQSIAFGEIGDQVVTNVVALGAVASSGLPVEYSVEGPAVLEGSVLRFSGVGAVSVTASQAGDGNWEAAEAVSVSFEVRKAVAGVVLEGLEQVYDGKTHRVGVGTVPEGLSVAVTYDGEESEPVGAGSYRVVATVVDEMWEGSAEGVLSIAKGPQDIVFPEIGPCGVADRVELSAVAGSGLEVVFAVLSGPGYLEGAVLRFADTGSVAVVAMQGGDGNWEAAEPVRQVVEVGKSAAAVVLGGLEQVYDGNAHAVAVETVPAGLAVEVAYGGSTNAPVDAGSYEVVATVVDAKWAGCATGVLHVAKGTQEIAFPAIGPQVVTNRVVLGAVASSGLPVGYAVVAGPGWVEDGVLSFSGVGEVAVVASQYGNGNWEAAAEVTNVVEVSGLLSLSVVSAHGVVSPAPGTHEVMIGTAVEAVAEAEPMVLGEGWRAVCTGWRLEGNGPEAGSGTVAAFTLTNSATLTWLWETQALVQAVGLAHGDAEGGGWYALGSTAVLRAVPDEGFAFTGWTGAVPGGQAGANPVELRVAGPGTAVATFYTTFYASVDGNDAADGLSWSTAKREIAAALALAAEGDSVVASDGAYGAVSVPDGVSVRSVGGADATRIAGGAGVRCVVAGAGASVEGFTLEGASVEGDGGGALLAGDAVLRRCVLQGNRAGGCGGGASGGTLENCLVVGNGASAGGGGGACGAVLRHCTVVRNEGGGARDCRSVNCVFWENGGDDVAGGETSWSRCSPVAPGSGNIEDDPVFAGGGDWRLAYESPCIDAAAESGVRVDLDGAPRPQPRVYGGELKPDMGCREYVPKARFVWDQGRAVPPYESWGDAARDIQSALDVSGSGDRIVVEAGTYGPIAVSNAVIVMGYRGAGETVIDAQGAERAVFLGGGGTLEGFTVRGGVSEDCGGILADGGSTVRDVVVEGCRATGAEGVGGGVCLYGGSVAENITARGNAAAYGAGVYATATSAVVRCEMDGNTASAWGGGAYLEADSRMECSRLSSNSAVRGGGLYGADCEVAACGLDGNAASGAGGGAALLRATFRNNRVAGNRAASGGGVHAQASDGHDCLVTGNEAPKGAGVWMEGDGQFWNFTVADNGGTGAGVALRGTSLFGNGIAWGNAGGNLDAAEGTEVRHSCAAPAPEGEGNFAADPSFVGDGDYHLRAGSPCVDVGEVQEWMASAYDLDGQRRVEVGEEGDGRDIWVDIGADEAALDAVEMPSAGRPFWTWRVVLDANLRLQRAAGLLAGTVWEDVDEPFTATEQTWTVEEPFDGTGARFYRLIWRKE